MNFRPRLHQSLLFVGHGTRKDLHRADRKYCLVFLVHGMKVRSVMPPVSLTPIRGRLETPARGVVYLQDTTNVPTAS